MIRIVVQELIESAGQQARAAGMQVRAPALLHLSRALLPHDRDKAQRVFDEALALISAMYAEEKKYFSDRILMVCAAVRPARIREFVDSFSDEHWPGQTNRVVQTMLEHGHTREAAAYVRDPAVSAEYPDGIVPVVLQLDTVDKQERIEILGAAVAAWRRNPNHRFLPLFGAHGTILPQDEARGILREALDFVLAQPDRQISVSFGVPDPAEIAAEQDYWLFALLPVLQRIDPGVLESLAASRPQFAKALARWPLGGEKNVSTPRAPAASGTSSGRTGGFAMAGNPRDFPMMRQLMEAERAGDVEPFFEHALRLYAEDSNPANPNRAPREGWPSTQLFRRALHMAGMAHGVGAISLLDRVPDDDLRLFSMITLAAALSGLPEMRLSQWTCRP